MTYRLIPLTWIWACATLLSAQAQPTSAYTPQIEAWYADTEDRSKEVLSEIGDYITTHPELSAAELTYLYHIQSECYFYLGDIARSDSVIVLSLAHLPPDFPSVKTAEIYNNHGQNLSDLGKLTAALSIYHTGLIYAKKSGDGREISNLYYNIALVNRELGNYHQSIIYLDSCFSNDLARQDSFGLSHTLRLIGSIHESYFNYDLARQSLHEALNYVSDVDPSQRCVILNHIGYVYSKQSNIDSTARYLSLAEECFDSHQDIGISYYLHQLKGDYALMLKDTAEAVRSYLTARALSENLGDFDGFITNSILAFSADPTAITAEEVQLLLDKGEEKGTLDRLALGYASLGKYYQQTGQFEKAYNAQERSRQHFEKQVQIQNSKIVASQSSRYEIHKQEADAKLAKAHLEARQARLINWGLLIGAILLGLIGVILYKSKKYKLRLEQQRMAQETSLLQEIAQVESQALRAQMNPHFIFNALNSVKGLIVNKKEKEAALYISKLSKLLRRILDNSVRRTIVLSEELEVLELYMNLEQTRFRDKFTYTIDVDPSLNPEDVVVPPAILQPFVENAIWHGFKNNSRPNKLSIQFKALDSSELEVTVSDNGVGLSNTPKKEGRTAHGIHITRRRINNFSKDQNENRLHYQEPLDDQGRPLGTTVTIRLPLKTKMYET